MAQKSPKPLPSLNAPLPRPRPRSPIFILLVGLLIILIAILGVGLYLLRPQTPHRVSAGQDTIHVLFIGNSYTYVNNLPGLLIELAANEPKPIDAEMVVVGGARLADHWTQGNALAAIQREHWDYVVLQEQSTLGSSQVINGIDQIADPKLFHQYVRLFNTEIQKVGAKPLLYMTWARQNAPQNQDLLTKAYMDIAHELHIMVAPVGLAWAQALSTYPKLVLHQDDGSHPNSTGSYLAACVFYATIYQKSPIGLPARISNDLVDASGVIQSGRVNLNPVDAQNLQQIAWQIVSSQSVP